MYVLIRNLLPFNLNSKPRDRKSFGFVGEFYLVSSNPSSTVIAFMIWQLRTKLIQIFARWVSGEMAVSVAIISPDEEEEIAELHKQSDVQAESRNFNACRVS